MSRFTGIAVFSILTWLGTGDHAMAAPGAADHAPRVTPNDNRAAAGRPSGDTLVLALRAGAGVWQPEGPSGPALTVEALGEADGPLMVPAPLIRAAAGTTLAVSITNELQAPLRVHGLCERLGKPCAPVDVPAGERRELRFSIGAPGTYHYWATSIGAPFAFREMAGALVVDPPDATPGADRVFVITEWTSLTAAQLREIVAADEPTEAFVANRPRFVFTVNGLSWPATERLAYRRGETVRWRVLNLSSQIHPMHLHGFYFDVTHVGDGTTDRAVVPPEPRTVVTHVLRPGGTMALTWTPERPGNWLFHCHMMSHVAPARRFERHEGHNAPGRATDAHASHDASLGMAGLVLGITVTGSGGEAAMPTLNPLEARRLTLEMHEEAGAKGAPAAAGFRLQDDSHAQASSRVQVPGPTLVLRRGEPVEITLENRLSEATAIHWHGMELESRYDGVHGWSGIGPRTTPMIALGERFVVQFTPPRTGTFFYHTHVHDFRQLSAGLFGPMVVVDPDTRFDPDTDHVLVVSREHVSEEDSILGYAESLRLNGQRAPKLVWRAGVRHRVRLINITPDDVVVVSVQTRTGPANWTPLTKDGAPVAAQAPAAVPAVQAIAVGETYDFEVLAPTARQPLWIDVRSTSGRWLSQGQVIVK